MFNISKIDSNFAIQTELELDHVKFYDIQQEPFTIYGVFHENGLYRRMPEAVAKTVNPGVERLHQHTAIRDR